MVQIAKPASKGIGSRPRGEVAWEEAPTEIGQLAPIITIYGETSTGRTTLALSAPGPIAYLHSAEKITGIVQPAAREKKIKVYNFGTVLPHGNADKVMDQAGEVWAALKAAMLDALGWARTVVLDTHTDAWTLLRAAAFGKLTQVRPHHYTRANQEWLSLVKHFRMQDRCSLVAVGEIRERYRNDKPTGIMEQSGQKSMSYFSDTVILTQRNINTGTFSAVVEKAWWNDDTMRGLEVEDEEMTLPYLMSLITETDEGEWR